MSRSATEQKKQLIDQITTSLDERLSNTDNTEQVKQFAQHYYAHVAPDDLLAEQPDDLYGALLSHWNFAQQRPDEKPLIRVYNPNYDHHGWQSTHTIVEIVSRDMSFLVDSVIMELNRRGLRVHLIIHPVLAIERDQNGNLVAINNQKNGLESFIHCQIDHQPDADSHNEISRGLAKVLHDIHVAVTDWPAMQAKMETLLADLDHYPQLPAELDIEECKAFLRWLVKGNFTFLGYRAYDLEQQDNELLLRTVANSGLGVLRDDGRGKISPSFAELPAELRQLATAPALLMLSKSGALSTVHRPAHMDYIALKRFNDDGKVIGEQRFLGLYTSAAYNLTPRDIPLLRQKTQAILTRSQLTPQSHAGKALQNILATFPRDELFQISEDELFTTAIGILHLQERQQLRLFVRQDLFQRFLSCLIYVPRDYYDTDLRLRMQELLSTAFNANSATFATQFSESVLARVHFHIRTTPGTVPDYSVTELEQLLRDAMLSWEDHLHRALIDSYGEAQGNRLCQYYDQALPLAYKEDFNVRTAVSDIGRLEALGEKQALQMHLYRTLEDPQGLLHFKVFGSGEPMPLSDALPILERMGLRVITARPYQCNFADGNQRWILTFDMQPPTDLQVDINEIRGLFQQAFACIWEQHAENDSYNYLVLAARLPWRDVAMLRAYSKYLLQARFPFSQDYMQQAMGKHAAIVNQLVTLFHCRFDPDKKDDRIATAAMLTTQLEQALEQVESLDEDRILRRFLTLIQATWRTNYFQADNNGKPAQHLVFKFDPSVIPDLPLPLPMFEIFVYSPRVEAVHLRGGPVARGGLRWSDRREDFRTEVLGLMKAQMVKNSVIVPVGSKGGFVVKQPPVSREELQQEVRECYSIFIRGMLDITDNRNGDEIIPPARVVRYDADDPYLVVAADKGTATFSDLANSIALDYGFWLGDAFASGGSNGYDHKGMGITAKGAWESVKRHFRELDIDIQNRDDFTVVGIGDMAGDVFGNGMLLSPHIKLLAAFNHLHIFLDPDPDPERSYAERQRLFELPRSSWADYNTELLSAGGNIFSRSAKSIPISPQVRQALAINATSLPPNELLHQLLQAPVDLLWNGGIGTYVKASSESHTDADDRSNDAVRVDASQLRCKVVGEGGNLGFTQRGRIEYALNGGHMLTDAIDNSAGVNCSDHEVNIKILLNSLVGAGDMTAKQRNRLLAKMTDEVAELVLQQNYLQPQIISITQARAAQELSNHNRAMRALEQQGSLNRAIEFLPDEEEINARTNAGSGLSSPELAVLLAYNKIHLFAELMASDVLDDGFLQQELHNYFPQPIQQQYAEAIASHPLRREIIATRVTNDMLNRMGSTYVLRLREEHGAATSDITRAYTAARTIFQVSGLCQAIEQLDNQVNTRIQRLMHMNVRRLLERSGLWLLRNRRAPLDINAIVEQFSDAAASLMSALPDLLSGEEQQRFEQRQQSLSSDGVPEDLAIQITELDLLDATFDICEIAAQATLPVKDVTSIYFALSEQLEMNWLRDNINQLPSSNHWQRRARAALLTSLTDQCRALTADVISNSESTNSLDQWLTENQPAVSRLQKLFEDLRGSTQQPELAMLSVALREVGNLVV